VANNQNSPVFFISTTKPKDNIFLRHFSVNLSKACSMIGTKLVANRIYEALQPHEDSVRHVCALALWNRPFLSGILLFAVEALFLVAYCLPFNTACILCLLGGAAVFLSALHDAAPRAFGLIKAFQIHPRAPGAPDRVRSAKEIAAYLTTVLSVWTKFVSLIFSSIADVGARLLALTSACFVAVLMLVWLIGDFWLIWGSFHIVCVVPGVIALPTVQAWIRAAERGPSADASDDGRPSGEAAAGEAAPGDDSPAHAGAAD
jgi:hypothetical protein